MLAHVRAKTEPQGSKRRERKWLLYGSVNMMFTFMVMSDDLRSGLFPLWSAPRPT